MTREDQGELLAAKARGNVKRPARLALQGLGDGFQRLVTLQVAVVVVIAFEVVDINQGQAQRLLSAQAQADFAFLDPTYSLSVPFKQVISGAFDTLSHAMETYFGIPADTDLKAVAYSTVLTGGCCKKLSREELLDILNECR